MIRQLLALTFTFLSFSVFGQDITIKRTDTPIKIDGEIDTIWANADSAYNFTQFFPMDTSLAESSTVAKILYDDQNIYVLGIMQNINPDRDYYVPSLRRDFFGQAVDSFTILIDAFQDNTNAFMFGVSPFGVRREGLIVNGGSGMQSFSLDWDNIWRAETKRNGDHWVAEMAIPFKSIRFSEGQTQWNVNFYRIDSEHAEQSTWSPIPRNFGIINLASLKKMGWPEATKKPGSNISFIPYMASGVSKNFQEGTPADANFDAGFDLKYAVTPGLNLDLTVNPDFSQVEVDRQVTNLDRFEIFFPERRQFFLENADLFANYGNRGTRPFFSRRIGVARDESTGQNIQNAIPVGARLSGKVNDNLRLGFLNMQAGAEGEAGLPSYNYSVLSLQQKVLARSNFSFLLVNKQTFEDQSNFDNDLYNVWNRTLGLEYNHASADNRWTGKAFYHKSIDELQPDDTYAAGLSIEYGVPEWSWRMFSQTVGENFNPEVGFVRRRDVRQFANTFRRSFFPSSGPIQRHGPGFDFDMVWNDEFGFLDWDMNILYDINWRSSARFSSRLRRQYTYLFNGFDPSGSGGTPLPSGTGYHNNLLIASYNSDNRKPFYYRLSTRSGEYFNGTRVNLEGELNVRYQPFGFTGIAFAYNRIRLPDPYSDANLFLIGPRFDFTFTDKLFWTTFVQYNSQIDNLNINSRLQWRFAPVSDFFLVYTDNYLATDDEGFNLGPSKSRALVVKLTYWLNF